MLKDIPEFANGYLLWLLLLIPLMAAWYWYRYKKRFADVQLSSTSVFEQAPKSIRQYLIHVLFALRLLAIGFLIIALARPYTTSKRQDVSIEGIDIVMTLDVSSSMLAMDLKPDRLEAAKNVALEFIQNRPNDRIGLVVFSGESFTQVPLTTDHSVLSTMFEEVESGMIEDGTAIGEGLATAVNRLKDSKAISKVVILLTDGISNMGSVDPMSAAEIAKMFGVRVYTIGVGSHGTAPYPQRDVFGRRQIVQMEVEIDEQLLKDVAEMTDGKYFRATSNQKLKAIYQEIDQLEKSKIDVTQFEKRHEEFLPLVLIAIGLIIIEVILRNTYLKTLP